MNNRLLNNSPFTNEQSDKNEIEELKKTLYFSEQKSILNPNTKAARDELDNMVKYISLSAQKTEMELNRALNQ